MQDKIHPNYKPLKLILTNGDTFTTNSTCPENELILDMDITNHPAWVGGSVTSVNQKVSQVAKFNDRFSAFNMFVDAKKDNK